MTPTAHHAAPHRSAAFKLDPYLIDECTFTRGEILRARGMVTARRRPTRRTRAVRPAPGAHRHAA
jgi:hypothetical protein